MRKCGWGWKNVGAEAAARRRIVRAGVLLLRVRRPRQVEVKDVKSSMLRICSGRRARISDGRSRSCIGIFAVVGALVIEVDHF